MGLLLMVGPVLLPEHLNPNAGRLDVLSAALSLAAVLPVIYGVKFAAEGGDLLWPLRPSPLACCLAHCSYGGRRAW
jgi:DHA2 family multidrug resistance protein-like MFS transporter